jgi:nitrate/nitrite transport system substrate-binding protein
VNGRFATERRAELKSVMKAILEASAWLDDMTNRGQAAATVGSEAYVNAPADVIDARLMGRYDLGGGLGSMDFTDDMMLFHRGGETNFPRVSHGIWFLAQYARFGRLAALPPEVHAMAASVVLQDLYREVAGEVGVSVPDDDMTPFTVEADGIEFDPHHPEGALGAYAELFEARANAT